MKRLLLLLTLLSAGFSMAQTQFWQDNFDSSPTSGTRTPEENGGSTPTPSISYFKLTDGTDVAQVVPFSGKEGTFFWAGEDHNGAGTGFTASGAQGAATNSANNELQIEWTNINIAGKSTLSFKGLIAAASTNQPWDNTQACASGVGTTNTDYIIVEYKIDAGAYAPLFRFFTKGMATNGTDRYLFEDTNNDGCGDGTQLTNTFGEFTRSIPGTGTTMSLRIRVFSEGDNEEWGIDNFRLFEVAACTAPVITTNPPNRSICVNGNTTFTAAATGATAYQWQVNTGSGFTDISNGGVYSNATTTTLNITGALGTMNGYTYRCRAMNGVATCFTNTNAGTLNISNMSSSTAKNDVLCFGNSTGSAAVSAPTGGIGTITYSWAPSGGTNSIATGLAAGTYTVTITDGISCQITKTITITQPSSALNAATGGGKTDVSCNGGSNGTATVAPTGGTPGYTYSWAPSGGTAATASGLAANTYTVTVTDANNCQATRSYTITQPATAVNAAVGGGKTDVSCNGGSNGTATVAPTGGTPSYTYSWAPSGGTAATASGLAVGVYTVTVTDANACQATRSYTITQPPALSGSITKTDVSCNGGSNGTATVSISGGTPSYTYSWAPSGGTNATATGLGSGTYTCTITDANACQLTRTITVNQPAAALGGTATKTDVSCNGGSNGTATVSPTGGTTPYSYSWSPSGGTNATATGLATGTYTCTITDFNGCQITRTVTVNQPATALNSTITKTDVSCNGGSNGTTTVSPSGGTPSYTYSWAPSGGTAATATGLAAGTYTCTITDANACQITRTVTVNQPATALGGTITKTDVSCNGGSNGTTTVSITGGTIPYSYSWAPSGGTNATATGLASGTYTCTITDFNGCQITRTATVNQPAAALSAASGGGKTDVSCNGGSNGTATVAPTGGTIPYSYSWTPSGGTNATATGLAAGTYTVTVTDFNGCQTTRSYTISQPATALSAATGGGKTDVSCNGGSNGTATVAPTGGTPAYTYSWAPSGGTAATASGLAAGTYTVTVTDANNCQTTRSYTINQPTLLVASATAQTNITCNGGTTGSATVSASGGVPGYTYSWSPSGGTAATASGLAAGTYTVTVTDANNCQATQSFTITQPTAISFTAAAQTNIACNGGNTGAFAVNPATGGTGAFTYDWAPGTPTGDGTTSVTQLMAGTYSVTATDANGCTASISFTITEPPVLQVTTTSQTNVSCNSGSNGTATVAVMGGTPGYSYSWSPIGGTAATATGLASGTYTVTVTDANGCSVSQSFTITQPTVLDLSANSQVNVTCNGGSTGSATVTPTGGTGTYTYSWAPSGGTASSATGLEAGTYTVTVTDANNCQATQSFTITEPALITSSFSHDACNSYTWGTQTHSTSGTYTQTFTAVNGCDSIVTLTLSIVSEVTNTVTESSCISYTWAQNGMTYNTSGLYVDTIPAVGGCDSIVTLDLTITTPSSSSSSEFACGTYTWAQNGMTYTTSGAYTDTIPNAAGCDSIITLNLTIGGYSASESVTVCESYTWAQTGIEYTVSGMYADTLTDVNGCDSILVLNLTVTGLPVVTATNNGDATITASAGSSYQWINCTTNTPISGATAQTFTATANGTYAVIVTNAANCSDTSNCVVISNVGLDEKNTSLGVILTPNPTQNDVSITFTGVSEASVVIYDAQGKVVMTRDHIQSGEVLSMSTFERGVYLINIHTNSGNHTERLVKQ